MSDFKLSVKRYRDKLEKELGYADEALVQRYATAKQEYKSSFNVYTDDPNCKSCKKKRKGKGMEGKLFIYKDIRQRYRWNFSEPTGSGIWNIVCAGTDTYKTEEEAEAMARRVTTLCWQVAVNTKKDPKRIPFYVRLCKWFTTYRRR